jgi:hypothetical protein
MNRTIIKNIFALICLGGLGLVMTVLGSRRLMENLTRNLNKTDQIKGTIELTQVVTESKKIGAVPFTYIDQDYLGIKLKSTNQLFGTFNPKQSYEIIQRQLYPGRQVTLYYYNTTDHNPTNNVFQIESGGEIIVNHMDYKKNHSIAAIIIVCFGLLCIGMDIWLIKTKDLRKDWAK